MGDARRAGSEAHANRVAHRHKCPPSLSFSGLRQYCSLWRQFNYIGISELVVDTLLAAIEGDPEEEKTEGYPADDIAQEPQQRWTPIPFEERAVSVDHPYLEGHHAWGFTAPRPEKDKVGRRNSQHWDIDKPKGPSHLSPVCCPAPGPEGKGDHPENGAQDRIYDPDDYPIDKVCYKPYPKPSVLYSDTLFLLLYFTPPWFSMPILSSCPSRYRHCPHSRYRWGRGQSAHE